jgi:hypothetical protein
VAGGKTSPWAKPSCDISPRGDIPKNMCPRRDSNPEPYVKYDPIVTGHFTDLNPTIKIANNFTVKVGYLKWGSVEERQYQLGNKRNKILVHTRYKDVIKNINKIGKKVCDAKIKYTFIFDI